VLLIGGLLRHEQTLAAVALIVGMAVAALLSLALALPHDARLFVPLLTPLAWIESHCDGHYYTPTYSHCNNKDEFACKRRLVNRLTIRIFPCK
jgi:hypothetical protein